MRKSLFTKILVSAIVLFGAIFSGCNTEKVTFDSPEIEVSPNAIPDAPQAGGIIEINVETNRAWKVVVPADIDWIMPEMGFASGEGRGTAKLSLLPNAGFDRETTVKISTSTVYAAVRIVQPGAKVKTDLYSDNFNSGTVVIADKGQMPIGDYTGWNKMGPGSANVTYSGTSGATVRYTSTVAPSPSTPNDIYFGAGGGDFIVHNIGKGTATNLTVEFETASYNAFNADQMTVWVSTAAAPDTWTQATVTRASALGGNKWTATKAEFSAESSASQINIKFSGKDIRLFSLNLWAEGIIDMPKIPILTTNDATLITKTTAQVTGVYTYDGTSSIDEVGVAYCNAADVPQTFTNIAANPKPVPGAVFTVELTGLTAGTDYNYKTYVKIGADYYYGQQKSFSSELGGTLLLNETFGAPAARSTDALADYTGLVTTGAGSSTALVTGTKGATAMNVSVRPTGVSSGYNGASGAGNAYFGGSEAVMYLYNIGVGTATNLKLTFGMTRSTDTTWDDTYMVLSYSYDNITWTPIAYTRSAAGPSWALTTANVTVNKGVVSFKFAAGATQIRIDDITLVSTAESVVPAGIKMTGATAENVEITTATLKGTYTSSVASPSEIGIYYRKATESTLIKSAATGIASPISVALAGLTAETDYIFIPYAVVGSLTYYGPMEAFKTKSATPPTEITIAALRAKELSTVLSVNEKVVGVVISNRTTSGSDPKSLVIQNGLTAGSGITIRFAVPHSFNMGDKVTVLLDGGKVTSYNSLLQFTPKDDSQVTTDGTETLPAPVQVTPTTLNLFQSMLVKVDNCQVVAADKGKAMSTLPNMVTSSNESFELFISSTATFKTEIVPSGQGAAIGIAVVNGAKVQLQPRAMTDLAGLSGARFMTFGVSDFDATTIKQGQAIVAGKVSIPYFDAPSAGSYVLSVAVSGAAAAGIDPVTNLTVNYNSGDGALEIPITGTPTAVGKVIFTISAVSGFASTSCDATVGGPGAETVVDVDFSLQANYPAGFPSANGTKDVATYTFAEHSFVFAAGDGYYKGPSSAYLMIGKANSYVELPAIAGKTLSKVVLTSTSAVSGSAKIAVKAVDASAVTGGEEQLIKVASPYEITYTLSGTTANTAYRLYVTTAYNAQIAKLSLTYTE